MFFINIKIIYIHLEPKYSLIKSGETKKWKLCEGLHERVCGCNCAIIYQGVRNADSGRRFSTLSTGNSPMRKNGERHPPKFAA